MAYDDNFYRKYSRYLKEKRVRESHDFVFDQFRKLVGQEPNVVDFGCGLGEFWQYCPPPLGYVGVDVNRLSSSFPFIWVDYHDLLAVKIYLHTHFVPDAFISLFSIELFHTAAERYDFYRKIFETFPSIEYGLAGGMFYESKRGQETVIEKGDIISHQTIEDPSLFISDLFSEFRLHIHTPSQMFGPDVIEVWKILIRR